MNRATSTDMHARLAGHIAELVTARALPVRARVTVEDEGGVCALVVLADGVVLLEGTTPSLARYVPGAPLTLDVLDLELQMGAPRPARGRR